MHIGLSGTTFSAANEEPAPSFPVPRTATCWSWPMQVPYGLREHARVALIDRYLDLILLGAGLVWCG